MIWWEVDGGEVTVPSGGETASSSSKFEQSYEEAESILDRAGTHTEGTQITRVSGVTRSTSMEVGMTAHASSDGNQETRKTEATHWSSSTASSSYTEASLMQSYSGVTLYSTTGSTEERGVTGIAVTPGVAMHMTMSFSRTIEQGWTISLTYISRTVYTGSDGSTHEGTASSSYTTTDSSSMSFTTSSSSSLALPGTAHSQTSTTFTCIHHGTTTATETTSVERWTESDGTLTTFSTSTTRVTTATTDYTVTGVGTTTISGTIGAGHLRDTIIIADGGSRLLVASARDAEGAALASEWYTDASTSTRLAALDVATLAGTFHSTLFDDDDMTTVSLIQTDYGYGFGSRTLLQTFQRSEHLAGYTTADAGTLITPGGLYSVGLSVASWHFYFPVFGFNGPLTLWVSGPATLALTLNPRLSTDSSAITLSFSEGEMTTTFAPGIDVKVNACMAYAPGDFGGVEFAPWIVNEVPANDAPLRVCG